MRNKTRRLAHCRPKVGVTDVADSRFLAKPYDFSSLAFTVRECLDVTLPADAPIPAQTG